MRSEYFIHPNDAATLQKLREIPALPSLMEKFFQYGYDELMWSQNVSSNLRLSEAQLPEVYNHLPPICEKLGIPVPELYVEMSPYPNAYTSGHNRVYIVLTMGLIRRFKDEELDAVLAHECGHILCQHVLFTMLARALFAFGDMLLTSLAGQIGNIAIKPLKQSLFSWERASELSADRVACMITSADTLTKVLAKLERIPPSILAKMNYEAWANQGAEYEEMKFSGAYKNAIRLITNMDLDHPYGPVRAYEAKIWENSEVCKRLKGGIKMITSGHFCPQCGFPIEPNWGFCKKCGLKLK